MVLIPELYSIHKFFYSIINLFIHLQMYKIYQSEETFTEVRDHEFPFVFTLRNQNLTVHSMYQSLTKTSEIFICYLVKRALEVVSFFRDNNS